MSLPKGWLTGPHPYPHIRRKVEQWRESVMNPKPQRASERRIAALIAELDRGSADDALRAANEIAARAKRRM